MACGLLAPPFIGRFSTTLFTSMLGLGANGSNNRMVIELANVKPGDRVLDVGCGTGNLTLTAHSNAGPSGKVHGTDATPEIIELASKKASRAGLKVVFDVLTEVP